MTQERKHSPLPWVVAGTTIYTDETRGFFNERGASYKDDPSFVDNINIAEIPTWMNDVSKEETRANAEFIVRACNNHYKLLEALRFYADEHKSPNEGPWGIASQDFGDVARKALAEAEAE